MFGGTCKLERVSGRELDKEKKEAKAERQAEYKKASSCVKIVHNTYTTGLIWRGILLNI